MDEATQKAMSVKHVRQAMDALREHFDNVQIFVSRDSPENGPAAQFTENVQLGSGNWFARYGQVKAWTVQAEEELREECRPQVDDDD